MKQQLNGIEEDTVLVPYLIAERAIRATISEKFPKCNPDSTGEVVAALSPILCERAEMHYKMGKTFTRQITAGGGDRDLLYAFFCHWTQAAIMQGKGQAFVYKPQSNRLIKL